MRIIKYKGSTESLNERPLCCALGFFDGVHAGHRHLIEKCIATARSLGLCPAVFTFCAEAMNIKSNAPRLYTTEEKIEIFKELGVELTVLCDFDSVREITPEIFVCDVLISNLNCDVVITGEGFRFGKDAVGDTATLKRLMEKQGKRALIVDDLTQNGVKVSSTEVRRALKECRIKDAMALLGAPYFITGKVKRGRGVGHKYGFPTINTELQNSTVLQTGVYKSELKIDGVTYTGLTNIGTCPTFDEREIHAETMILGFSGDLYGRDIKIGLIDYIRGEKKFSSPEALRAQINDDIKELE